MVRLSRLSDLVIALLVVAITGMLLIPLPTPLVDVLIVLNISFALVLLLVGLYLPNALALLSFPSLLLLSTLFRLALNVASSRLILSQADAGEVIHAFGTFLIRGEIVVGVIIFSIVTIVNFIVIARGSARVSEVAARFVLDALPGKQMAIDSDLRSGLITAQQAQERREDLRKESQLYGSMDGAMKFVQGDAIAGICIIFTNIIGGLYLGVSQGMSFPDAIETYTVLTVGDGLVTQIPALFISICAGIVVTRVSSTEGSTLGSDVGTQLLARPGAIVFSGVVLALFGLLPVIPALPFMLVGAFLAAVGSWLLYRQSSPREQEMLDGGPLPLPMPRDAGGVRALPNTQGDEGGASFTIVFDGAALFRLFRLSAPRYQEWWGQLQHDFQQETGIPFPGFRVIQNEFLVAGSFEIYFGDTLLERGALPLDNVMVEMNPTTAKVLGLEVNSELDHPVDGSRVFWSYQSPTLRRMTEAGKVRTFDFFEYVALRAGEFCRRNPEIIFGSSDVFTLLKGLEKRYPGLITEAFHRHFVGVPLLTEVLHHLVRQGGCIRDFKGIIEAVSAWCSMRGIEPSDESETDVHGLLAFVRGARRRHLLANLLSPGNRLRTVGLSPSLTDALEEVEFDPRTLSAVAEPSVVERLKRGFDEFRRPIAERGVPPVCVVCTTEQRGRLESLARTIGVRFPLVAFDELEPGTTIERVAVWNL